MHHWILGYVVTGGGARPRRCEWTISIRQLPAEQALGCKSFLVTFDGGALLSHLAGRPRNVGQQAGTKRCVGRHGGHLSVADMGRGTLHFAGNSDFAEDGYATGCLSGTLRLCHHVEEYKLEESSDSVAESNGVRSSARWAGAAPSASGCMIALCQLTATRASLLPAASDYFDRASPHDAFRKIPGTSFPAMDRPHLVQHLSLANAFLQPAGLAECAHQIFTFEDRDYFGIGGG